MTNAEINVVADALRRECTQLHNMRTNPNCTSSARFAAAVEHDILNRALGQLQRLEDTQA